MTDAADIRLLVFRVGNLVCAAEVDRVREILPRLTATRIPGAPPPVAGLVNIRGTLVTVVEGWRALNQPDPNGHVEGSTVGSDGPADSGEGLSVRSSGSTTILLEVGRPSAGSTAGPGGGGGVGGTVGTRTVLGLTVDAVLDLLVVSADALEPRQSLPGLDPIFVRAVGRHGDGLVVVLDPDALFAPILSS